MGVGIMVGIRSARRRGGGGGGGGTPEWVPAGANAFIDLDNSRAWIDGVGEIADLTTVRDPVTGVCSGALLTRLVLQDYAAQAKFTLETTWPGNPSGWYLNFLDLHNGDESNGISFYAGGINDAPLMTGVVASEYNGNYAWCGENFLGLSGAAMQIQVDGVAGSTNGKPVYNQAAGYPTFVVAGASIGTSVEGAGVLHSLTLYPNTQTDQQLRDLSILPLIEAERAPSGDLPLVFSDFRKGAYALESVAVDVDDMWEENLDWAEWDASTAITAGVGALFGGVGPVMTPAAYALFPDGVTAVLGVNMPSGSLGVELLKIVDYSFEYIMYINSIDGGTLGDGTDEISTNGTFIAGLNRIAGTLVPTHIAGSLNGTAVVSDDDTPSSSPDSICLYGEGPTSICEEGLFYAPQPEADLPTLSAL